MQAIQVKCPNCAAVLRVSADAMVASCDYCHTQSHIQRRTLMLQRPVRMPPVRGGGPPIRPARQVVRRSMVALSGTLALIPFVTLGGAFYALRGNFRQAAGVIKDAVEPYVTGAKAPSSPGPRSDARWVGISSPLLADVDRDGRADVIGRMRYLQKDDRAHLVALSGATGQTLWESAAIGTYGSTIQSATALAGDLILFADGAGSLVATELASGKTRFTVSLSDRAERFCRRGDGAIAVASTDGAWHEIKLADGAIRPTRKEPRCDRLAQDSRDEIDPAVTVDESPRRSSQAGMRIQRELRRGRGPAVAAGWKIRGTAVPMVAGLDDRGRVTWKAEVPDGKPLEARQNRGLWTVTDGAVCTTYERTDDSRAVHLTCFALDTGARAWDRSIPSGTTPLTSLVGAGDRLYLSGWGFLTGFDAATGREVSGFPPDRAR